MAESQKNSLAALFLFADLFRWLIFWWVSLSDCQFKQRLPRLTVIQNQRRATIAPPIM